MEEYREERKSGVLVGVVGIIATLGMIYLGEVNEKGFYKTNQEIRRDIREALIDSNLEMISRAMF
jgi:hypothetical protein